MVDVAIPPEAISSFSTPIDVESEEYLGLTATEQDSVDLARAYLRLAEPDACQASSDVMRATPAEVGLHWRIVSRFGLDANRDLLVDIPNTIGYVQAPLEVTLDASCILQMVAEDSSSDPQVTWELTARHVPQGRAREICDRVSQLEDMSNEGITPFVPAEGSSEDAALGLAYLGSQVDDSVDPFSFATSAEPIVRFWSANCAAELRDAEYTLGSPRWDGPTMTATTVGPELKDLPLYEGVYELAVTIADGQSGSQLLRREIFPVVLDDYLIVHLGDSYSAGEGAPEWDARYVPESWRNVPESQFGIWADDGSPSGRGRVDVATCPAADAGCVAIEVWGYGSEIEHELAHRSSFTWGSQAALTIEVHDPRTSVTYVNLASSGALVDHVTTTAREAAFRAPCSNLTADYERGARQPRFRVDGVPIPAYATNDWFYGVDDRTGEYGEWVCQATDALLREYGLDIQLSQLRQLIGPRSPDAVLISIGGNDSGFANAIAAYKICGGDESCPERDLDAIADAVFSGDWNIELSKDGNARVDVLGGYLTTFDMHRPGLGGLPAKYAELSAALDVAGISADSVYILEYPDPLVQSQRNEISTASLESDGGHLTAAGCNEPILTFEPDIPTWGRALTDDGHIGTTEQRRARSDLLVPLNILINDAARTHGWNIIGDSATAMYGQPLCAPGPERVDPGQLREPYLAGIQVQRPELHTRLANAMWESLMYQGDDSGVLHPNRDGYASLARALLRTIHLPNPVRTAADIVVAQESYETPFGEAAFSLGPPGTTYGVPPSALLTADQREGDAMWSYTNLPSDSIDMSTGSEVTNWHVGIEFSAQRVFTPIDPDWCPPDSPVLEIDVGEALPYATRLPAPEGNGAAVRIDQRVQLDRPAVRLVRYPAGDAIQWEDIERLDGYGTLALDTGAQQQPEDDYWLIISTQANNTAMPVRGAPVRSSSSYSNDYGMIQLTTRCGT